MNLVTTQQLTRSPHVRETHTQDGAVLLDVRRGKLYPLNPVAALIWRQLGEGFTPEQIAHNVATTCNISLEMATTDVIDFLESVLAEELASSQRHVEPTPSRRSWWRRLRDQSWFRSRGSSEVL